jgi:hypothetical protein
VGTVFRIRIVFPPLLFLWVLLFLAFLALSVHVRRIQKAQQVPNVSSANAAVAQQSR